MTFQTDSIQGISGPVHEYTADGAIEPIGGLVLLNNAADIDMTLTPVAGQIYTFIAVDLTTAMTITLGGGFTWDGTNDVATFDADGESITVWFGEDRAYTVVNPGSVAFS